MTATRTETDSFGPIDVPADRYWGAQTQRSIRNFPIGWDRQPAAIIHALGLIKQACAASNKARGTLPAAIADAMVAAAAEVAAGREARTSHRRRRIILRGREALVFGRVRGATRKQREASRRSGFERTHGNSDPNVRLKPIPHR